MMGRSSKRSQARQFVAPLTISILLHLVSGVAVLLAFPARPFLTSHEPGKALMVFFPDLSEKQPEKKQEKQRPRRKPPAKKRAPVVKKTEPVVKKPEPSKIRVAKREPPKAPPPPEPKTPPAPPEPETPVEAPVMPPPVKKDLSVAKPESPKIEPTIPSQPLPPPPPEPPAPEAPPEKPQPVVEPPPPEPVAPEPPPEIPEPVVQPPVEIPEPDQPVVEHVERQVPLEELNPPRLLPEVKPVETAPPPVPKKKPPVPPPPFAEPVITLRSIEPEILKPEKRIFFPMAETKIPMKGPMIARETGHPPEPPPPPVTVEAEASTAEPVEPYRFEEIRPEELVAPLQEEVRPEDTVPEQPVVAEVPEPAPAETPPPPVEAPAREPVPEPVPPEPVEEKKPEEPAEEPAPEAPPETVKAPAVAITEPREGETVDIVEGGSVTIRGSVDDPTVETATVVVNGERQEVTVREGRFELHTKRVERQNTISVEATNRAGIKGSSPLLKFFTALFKPPDVLAILNAASSCRGLKLRLFKGEHPRAADYRPFAEPKEAELKTEPVDSDPSSWSVMAMIPTAETAVYMVQLDAHAVHSLSDCNPHLIIVLYGYDPVRSRTMVFPLADPFFRRPGAWVVTKFLMPQGFFWDDPSWATGQVDNGRVATRFNTDAGITWKERR
jgi:hypothetical protein